MGKVKLNSELEFLHWKSAQGQCVGTHGINQLAAMNYPTEYPVILCANWETNEINGKDYLNYSFVYKFEF